MRHRSQGKAREERDRIARRALELQKQGVTIAASAQRLGVSPSYIHAAIKALRDPNLTTAPIAAPKVAEQSESIEP